MSYKTVEQVEVDIEKAYAHLRSARKLLDDALALSEDSELPEFNRWRMSIMIPYLKLAVDAERERCDRLLECLKGVIAISGRQIGMHI